jgi:CRISPR/Cas system-associated exonuclease Cas4 (RecB family)
VEKFKPSIRQNVRNFIEGSAVHKTIEKCFKQSPILDTELAIREYPAIFDQVIVEQQRQGDIHLYRGETLDSIKSNGLKILKQGILAIKSKKMDEGLHHSEYCIGNYLKPYELSPGLFIQGSVDWVQEFETHLEIADFKSSKDTKYLSPSQVVMYVLALEKIFKRPVTRGFYLMLRTGQRVDVKITEDRKQELLIDLQEANNRIRCGKFDPDPSAAKCGGCSFRNDCKYSGASEKVTGVLDIGGAL